ncbi:hypothetical protein AB1Y20_012081 [Prymnesium parvum]|uniref:Uncharacterized protein n=1 Tax=Prymnesium parvum TaxID=97485 RepID=A0AB34IQA4_PRYPA
MLLALFSSFRRSPPPWGAACIHMSSETPSDVSSFEGLPPDLVRELMDDEIDDSLDEANDDQFAQLLKAGRNLDGVAKLARDVYFEELAQSLEDEEDDMPANFDVNSQSWLEYNFVADYGFDPLGLAFVDLHLGSATEKDRPLQAILRDYREAELRHGRLAMLAALAWPVQELLSPILSSLLHSPSLLASTGGRTPSVLNGGLEQSTIPLTLALALALTAAVDVASLRRRSDVGEGWMPGDFGFDPLRLLRGADVAARRDMQEKEINNGRLAMVAVATYVVEEAVTQKPIVELTPWLFKPLIAFPEVQRLFDGAFAISAFRPDL